jgi:transcription elongation GreA/GreB family factor
VNAEQQPRVSVGCWVKVSEEGTAEEEVFQIVDSTRANVLENKIPPGNAMAQALLGAEPGDEVQFDAPRGRLKFTVLEVGPT